MEITNLTVKLIVLLLPGIFGMFLIEKLTREKKLEMREYTTSIIMLSFISYFILYIFYFIGNICSYLIFKNSVFSFDFFKSLMSSDIALDFKEVFLSSVISIIVSLIITKIIFRGKFYSFFRKHEYTNLTGQDVWRELFHNDGESIDDYIYINDFNEKISYGGENTNYSYDSSNPELVLKNVIIEKDGVEGSMKCDRLYYNFDKNIKIIIQEKEKKKNEQKTRSNKKRIK